MEATIGPVKPMKNAKNGPLISLTPNNLAHSHNLPGSSPKIDNMNLV